MSHSTDNHSAAATDEYRDNWERIFGEKDAKDCRRHRSPDAEDMNERCLCKEKQP